MKSIFAFLVIVLLVFSTNSSFRPASPTDDWLPKEFNPKIGVLLFQDVIDKEKMKSYVTKNYPYKFDFVSFEDLYGQNRKYRDTSIDRFIVKPLSDKFDKEARSIIRYYFYDRMTHEIYPSITKGAVLPKRAFQSTIRAILKAIDSKM